LIDRAVEVGRREAHDRALQIAHVKIGIEPVGSTAPQAKDLVQSEFIKYAKAVKAARL
jgi:hypothetical protein